MVIKIKEKKIEKIDTSKWAFGVPIEPAMREIAYRLNEAIDQLNRKKK